VLTMFAAVIFDWDGTLADTRKAVVKSFQAVLSKASCHVSDGFIERLMGIGTKRTIIEAFKACHRRLDTATLQKLAEEKIRIQTELTKIVLLMDGATELLQALKGKTKIALATMSSRKVVEKLLIEKKIGSYFDTVVTTDEVGNPKPDPEVFLLSAAQLKVQPESCVVIEDSVFGVRAAKAAEMKCIAVSTGVYSKQELEEEHPDLLVSSLAEKSSILQFIFGESAGRVSEDG